MTDILSADEQSGIRELKRNVEARASLPGYEYRPKYKNWLIAVRKEYQLTGNRNPRPNFDALTTTELRVASQEVMNTLIDDAVTRYVKRMTVYKEELSAYEDVAPSRLRQEGVITRIESIASILRQMASEKWDIYAEACYEGLELSDAAEACYEGLELSDAEVARARNSLLDTFFANLSGFTVIDCPAADSSWWEGRVLLEREKEQYKVDFHNYGSPELVVEPLVRLPSTPDEPPQLFPEGVLRLCTHHPAIEVIRFNYEPKFTEKGRIWR